MAEPQGPTVRSRRNVRWMAAGILAICLGGLGAALLYANTSSAAPVIMIKRTVLRDQIITADDLAITSLSAPIGIEIVPADKLGKVVGRTATADLVRGGLLTPHSFGDSAVPAGAVRLGLRLEAGRLPSTTLASGTGVLLVPVARDGGTVPAGASVAAVLACVPVIQADGAVLVDVTVPQASGERVAQLAAADQLALIRLPQAQR